MVDLNELSLTLYCQFAEYKRKPLLNLGFILSLSIATCTLLSVLMLNHASKAQYQKADSRLGNPVAFQIMPLSGHSVSKQDYANMRRQGFSEVTPVIEFRKQMANGQWLSLKAMDLLALSVSKPETFDSLHVLLPKGYAKQLGVDFDKGDVFGKVHLLNQASGSNLGLPTRIVNDGDWGMTALLDIELAWQLFDDMEHFSSLLVGPLTKRRQEQLNEAMPEHLFLQKSWSLQQRKGFADALHLNLSALAMLSFVVSLFIAFQAAEQAWQSRSALSGQLRLLGMSLSTVRQALWVEAMILICLASVCGGLLAIFIVNTLLPLLGLTLNQLYQLHVSGQLTWSWQYALWAVAISSVGVLLSLLRQFSQISRRHISQTQSRIQRKSGSLVRIFAALLILVFVFIPELSWQQIMSRFALLLTIAVLFLPTLIHVLIYATLALGKKLRLGFQGRYLLQDAQKQINRRFLPLSAFYLALTASISASLMISSFERAFTQYLDKQLNEDLYIRYDHSEREKIADWLETQPNVKEYIEYKRGTLTFNDETIALKAYESVRQLDSIVIKSAPRQTDVASSGLALFALLKDANHCMINEQLALAQQITVGEVLLLAQGGSQLTCRVKAIYYDYGNPTFEVAMLRNLAERYFKGLSGRSFGVYYQSHSTPLKQRLIHELALDESQVIEPREVKKLALNIFAQTFVLTQSIAIVLLAIACLGLFLSAKTLELARKGDLAILMSLGYSRFELFVHMLGQWLVLLVSCILLSWPLAMVLANVLVSKVFPVSFGWSMPLVVDFTLMANHSFIALLCLIPALILPLYLLGKRGLG